MAGKTSPPRKGVKQAGTQRKYAKYQEAYEKENQVQIKLKINKKTEAELLEWILNQENRQGYIKQLIAKDMEAQKRKNTASTPDLT